MKKGIQKYIIIFLSLVLLAFIVVSIWRVNKRRRGLAFQVQELEQEIQAFQEKNQALRAQISEAETDEYWEKRLREQGFKKPGEQVAVILPPETSEEEQAGEKSGFWQRLLFWRD